MPLRVAIIRGAELLGTTPASVVVDSRPLTIGRDPTSDWSLPDSTRSLSGTHCRIVPDGHRYKLIDVSTNGTFVNGSSARIQEDLHLNDGDQLKIGPYVVRVEVTGGAAGSRSLPEMRSEPSIVAEPTRGGDPAAMARAPIAAEDSGMTIIHPAHKAPSPSPRTPVPKAPTTAAEDVWAIPPGDMAPRKSDDKKSQDPPTPVLREASDTSSQRAGSSLNAILAQRLGIDVGALSSQSDEDLVCMLADLLLAFAGGTREIIAGQNALLRELSCRQTMARRLWGSEALALSPTNEQAVGALLSLGSDDAVACVQNMMSTLTKQTGSMVPAARSAALSLATLTSPARLAKLMPRQDHSDRWLAAYGRLWHDLAPEWEEGFAEAFRLELGAALDASQSSPPGERR